MGKLYCAYNIIDDGDLADHKCDICGKLLCKICGYSKDNMDYCNECWQTKEEEDERRKTDHNDN